MSQALPSSPSCLWLRFDYETADRIFPGEADSVIYGITAARWLLWGSPVVRQLILRELNEDAQVAIRRFLADVTTR
jgi:hypothetical protein